MTFRKEILSLLTVRCFKSGQYWIYSASVNVSGILPLISLGPALGHHFTLHKVYLERVLVPDSLGKLVFFFFFLNPCLYTTLSVVYQKWNASARWDSLTEVDYAIAVFTSTFFLSLFRVLLCVKFSTSSSRSFFSLRGSKIEWVWQTGKQEESLLCKCSKPGPQVQSIAKISVAQKRCIFHIWDTSVLSLALWMVIRLPSEGIQQAAFLLCGSPKGWSSTPALAPTLLYPQGYVLGRPFHVLRGQAKSRGLYWKLLNSPYKLPSVLRKA